MNPVNPLFNDQQLLEILSFSPIATAVYTSDELIIQSANGAMLKLWGKDKSVMGERLEKVKPEWKDQLAGTLLKEVWATGISSKAADVPVELNVNGVIRTFYFNFCCQAVKNETDNIYCIVHTATEVRTDELGKAMLKEGESQRDALLSEQMTAEELQQIHDTLYALNNELEERVKERTLALAEEESEVRFRFLLNVMPQQVWTAKPDGALDYVNQVVCDDFGESGVHIIGQGWHEFIHPDDLPGCLKAWTTALNTGEEYMVEFRLRFHDQQYRWHLSRAVPLIENGEITLWLGTNTNIDLQKSNEQKKDEFLSIASHELKTPLTSIKAFNQLMQRHTKEGVLNKLVNRSAENILRLERLINDLLDVTKINAGKMKYTVETFKFSNMLLESIENVQHTTTSHQLILENKADILYTGDQFRLEQVMHNFLSNAVKYSPGRKKVIVKSWIELDSIVVSVRDFGIGIAADKLDKLFERYYRVDNADMRFEGLGLGLFISSEILKRHGGSFWIESKLGAGSTFNFRLPLTDDSETIPAVNHTAYFYQDSHITLTYNADRKQIEADWTGFQNIDSVKHGCMKMLGMINTHQCSKLVNDNRNVLGTWSDASEWVGEVYFPMMEQLGLKYIAWVFSPSKFSQLSAKKSLDVAVSKVITRFFTDIVEAEQWIAEV